MNGMSEIMPRRNVNKERRETTKSQCGLVEEEEEEEEKEEEEESDRTKTRR